MCMWNTTIQGVIQYTEHKYKRTQSLRKLMNNGGNILLESS